MNVAAGDDAYKPEEDDQPVTLTQAVLNDLIRDLSLSKICSAIVYTFQREIFIGTWKKHSTLIENVKED